MLPKFPEFKKLELSDKEDVEAITSKYPPYSDFNFVSMWSWDIKGEMRVSALNGNLVVRFSDYLTGAPFYSFIGINEPNETAKQLINYSKQTGLEPILKLVPEHSIKELDKNIFNIIEDRNHFDYILELQKIAEYSGRKFHSRRKQINNLLKKHKFRTVVIEELDENHTSLIHSLLKEIESEEKHDPLSWPIRKELDAVKRILNSESKIKLLILCVFIDDKLGGFAAKEIINADYCIGHFLKVAPNPGPDVYSFLMQQLAITLVQKGCKYINIEQDMGISGLRFWKMDHQPSFFLKKYQITGV